MGRSGRVTLKRKPQRLSLWFKLLLVTIAVASASLLVNAVVGQDGLLELQRQEERFQRLRVDVLKEQDRLDRLEVKARGIEKDPLLQEKIAREELDLVGEGEIVYLMHPEASPPEAAGDLRGTTVD